MKPDLNPLIVLLGDGSTNAVAYIPNYFNPRVNMYMAIISNVLAHQLTMESSC